MSSEVLLRILPRPPVYTKVVDYSVTTLSTSAWTELIAALGQPGTLIEIFNGSGSSIKLSTGTAGLEDSHIIPYTIIPGGSSVQLSMEFANAARISAKAVDTVPSLGSMILNFFG